MVCDELGHIVRHVQVEQLGLAADDGHSGLKVRRLNVRGEAPLEPGAQTFLQALDLLGRAVAGQHDLLARIVQGIKGMEELLLGALLAGDELDVVHQQHVRRPVFLAEALGVALPDGSDDLIGELLTVHIHNIKVRVVLLDLHLNGVEQVRFTKAGLAVDEQRVVGPGGIGGNRLRRRIGELVGGTLDEVFEGEVVFAAGSADRSRLFRFRGGLFRCGCGHNKLHLHIEAQHRGQSFFQQRSIAVPHDGADEIIAHSQHDLAAALEAHRLQPVDVQVVGGVHQALLAIGLRCA